MTDRTIGLGADLAPDRRMAALDRGAQLGNPAVVQIEPRMNPANRLQGRRERLEPVAFQRGQVGNRLEADRAEPRVDLGRCVVPFSRASQQERAPSGTRNSAVNSCQRPGREPS